MWLCIWLSTEHGIAIVHEDEQFVKLLNKILFYKEKWKCLFWKLRKEEDEMDNYIEVKANGKNTAKTT